MKCVHKPSKVQPASGFGYPQGEMSPENKGHFYNFCHFLFLKTSPELFSEEEFLPLDPTQELIFPPELMVRKAAAHLPGDLSGGVFSKAEGAALRPHQRHTSLQQTGVNADFTACQRAENLWVLSSA